MVLLLPLVLASTPLYAGVWEQLREAGDCDHYQPMTAQQLGQAESLFKLMLNGTPTNEDSLRLQWAALGFELIDLSALERSWWGLRESAIACRGQGYYLIQRGGWGQLMLQVPHAYFDRYTGEIGAGMLHPGMVALAWNSANRRLGQGTDRVNADLAKRTDSLFIALTRAFVSARPQGHLIQLHGFDNQRRKTLAGADAQIIVSAGSTWVTPAVYRVSRCLKPVLDGPIRVFPQEVTELGGIKNVQGRLLRRYGHEGFIHLELNLSARQRLRQEPRLRAQMMACLVDEVTE